MANKHKMINDGSLDDELEEIEEAVPVQDEPPAKTKSKKKLFVIIAIGIAMLLAIALTIVLIMGKKDYKVKINGDSATITFNVEGELNVELVEIASYKAAGCHKIDVIIGDSVTAIGDGAFTFRAGITGIELPKSVTTIGDRAFSDCSSLTSIEVDEGNQAYKSIDGSLYTKDGKTLIQYAIGKKDTRFEIPEGVTNIGSYAFGSCQSLTSVVIPEGVTTIGNGAFFYCSSLTSVVMPESVTTIGNSAFFGCSNLATVLIPKSVTTIGYSAFSSCSKLEIYCQRENSEGWSEIWIDSTRPVVWGHIHTPRSGYKLQGDSHTFVCDCGKVITEAHTYVDNKCLCGKSAYIDEWDVSIGNDGDVLLCIKEDPERKGYYIADIKGNGEMIGWDTYLDVPWRQAYGGKISAVNVENGVTSVGSYAFYGSSALTRVTLGDDVQSIGDSAFSRCESLTEVVLGKGLTAIGREAFYSCKALKTVVIPKGVTSMGRYAFSACTALSIYAEMAEQPSGWDSYWNYSSRPVEWGHTHKYDSATNRCVCGKEKPSLILVEEWDISSKNRVDSVTAYLYADPDNEGVYTLTISGAGRMESWTSASDVPWYSSYSGKISNVTIAEGVTSIGDRSFYDCVELTSIELPESITKIGDGAFYNCQSLSSINIPSGVVAIGNRGFYGCASLTSIELPEGLTTIDEGAFEFCSSLASIVIPDGVTVIDDYVFSNCSDLASVELPRGVTTIGDYAFHYCSDLTSIVVPEGVTSIGNYAFCGCTSLASVVIPEGVTTIGNSAFSWCYNITSIELSESVNAIGEDAFRNCGGITSITVSESNEKYKSIDGNLYTKDGKTLVKYATGKKDTHFEIPEGVTAIDMDAFRDCQSLVSVVIPEGVATIGKDAFCDCSNLTSVELPKSVTDMGKDAFYGCQSLASIELPEGVESIGETAFSGCASLTSIVIPNSVIVISFGAFENCDNLTIYCEALSQPSGWDYYWNYSDCPVVWRHTHAYENHVCICGKEEPYVEKWDISATENDSVTAYLYTDPDNSGMYTLTINGTGKMQNWKLGDTPWDSYSGKISSATIEKGVTTIGDHAFEDCTSLTSIVIPEGVTTIGDSAFSWCFSLTNIEIPESVTIIGNYAFSDCGGLVSIEIPESVEVIGYEAFFNCYKLTSVVIPEGVTTIGNSAFSWCYSLKSITVAEGNQAYKSVDGNLYTKDGKTLVQYAIGKNDASFEIPEGVTTIGERAFFDCQSLTNIVIPDGVTTICDYAFISVRRMTSIEIPDGVTTIGMYAFALCDSLKSIEVPDSVTTIEDSAFADCDSLTIYCEALSQPSGWDSSWNSDNCPVVWGHTHAYENRRCICGKKELPYAEWDISLESGIDNVTAYLYTDSDNEGMYTLTIEGTGRMKNLTEDSEALWRSWLYKEKILSVTIESGVTTIGNYAFYGCNSIAGVSISDGVTTIGDGAFGACTSLANVVIPDSLTAIGDSAFFGCYSLASVVIPEGATTIGDSAFLLCYSIESITVEEGNEAYKSIDGNLYTKDGTMLVQYAVGKEDAHFVIPEGVTTIGDGAFNGCNLTSIDIPNSVTTVGKGAFVNCDLASVDIPNSVTTISEGAFQGSSKLKKIIIPSSVTTIGNNAFSDCYYITIYCEAQSQPSGWNENWNYGGYPVAWGHVHAYDSATELCKCGKKNPYVEKWDISLESGADSVTAYLYDSPNNKGKYILTIKGTGKMQNWTTDSSVAPWYSSYRSKISSVTIEEGVTSIGNYAFYFCTNLTSIEISESVTTIGNRVLYSCNALTSINLPKGVTTIDEYAFTACTGLKSITVDEGNQAYKSIDGNLYTKDGTILIQYAVDKADARFVIPEGVTTIEKYAFSYCTSLDCIVIPESVTNIKDCAFLYCDNLTIYCEAQGQPSGWSASWNSGNRPVVWGSKGEE